MNIPEAFNIDIFQILADTYNTEFDRHTKKNIIGWSDLPYGMRKIALRKIHGKPGESNMKTLMGQLMNHVLQNPPALQRVVQEILKTTDIKPRQIRVVPEEELHYEINGEQFVDVKNAKIIEGHIDTYTDIFSWELKTTWNLSKYWSKEMAPHHAIQLNGYLGSKKQEWGVVTCINMRAFMNTFKSFQESSEKWTYNLPVHFNSRQFDLTVKKATLIFKEIDNNTANLECPVYDWECKLCNVREECGKEEIRCTFVDKKGDQCKKVMMEWFDCLTDEFKDKPICQHCYETKTLKRKPYSDMKYTKMYPFEVRYE